MSQAEFTHGMLSGGGRLSLIRSDVGGMAPADIMVSVGARVAQSPIAANRPTDGSKFSGFPVGYRQRKNSVFYDDPPCSPMTPFQMSLGPSACAESQTFKSRAMSTTAAVAKTESESEEGMRRASTGSVSGAAGMSRSCAIGRLTSSQKNKKSEQQVALLRHYFEVDDKPSR